jgi:hypothetical protein
MELYRKKISERLNLLDNTKFKIILISKWTKDRFLENLGDPSKSLKKNL